MMTEAVSESYAPSSRTKFDPDSAVPCHLHAQFYVSSTWMHGWLLQVCTDALYRTNEQSLMCKTRLKSAMHKSYGRR